MFIVPTCPQINFVGGQILENQLGLYLTANRKDISKICFLHFEIITILNDKLRLFLWVLFFFDAVMDNQTISFFTLHYLFCDCYHISQHPQAT